MEGKEKGNAAFAGGDYELAIRIYTETIGEILQQIGLPTSSSQPSLDGSVSNTTGPESSGGGREVTAAQRIELLPTLFNNRSASLYKLERFKESLHDAEQALQLKPDFQKAYHRKAQALIALSEFDQARDVYSLALDMDPENKLLRKQVADLDAKTGNQSAHAKIEAYIARNGTVKGCPTKLSMSMFENLDQLGEGNYSSVFKVRFRKTGELFALKVISKDKASRMSRRHPNLHNEIKMEKRAMLRMNHPNVAKLHGTMQDVSSLYMIAELCEGGELWAKMRFGRESMVSLRPSMARFYIAQLVNILEYLHRNGIIHRDLKPENLLLCPDPSSEGRIEYVKVIDFGTAYDTQITDLNGPNKFVGTPEYMSPEAISAKQDPTYALDIWSFGCTLFQLHSGRIPFKGNSPYLSFLKVQALAYSPPDYFEEDLLDLLRQTLQEKPDDRLGALDFCASLKAHKYFEGIDFARLLVEPVKPVPSLFELCVEAVIETFCPKISANPDTAPRQAAKAARRAVASKKRNLPAWATAEGTFSASKVSPRIRNTLMGAFEQRLVLGLPKVYKLFFDSATDAKFLRANKRAFVGMAEAAQGRFKDPYIIAHLGSLQGATEDVLTAVTRRLNTIQPTPKLLILSGNLGDENLTKSVLGRLGDQTSIVCCYDGRQDYSQHFGDTYYSFYSGGILIIVVDSFLLLKLAESPDDEEANAQVKWLEAEILTGKLVARSVIVVSHHYWMTESTTNTEIDQDCVLPTDITCRFMEKLQDAACELILCGAWRQKSFTSKRAAQNDHQTRTIIANTKALEDGSLRIVRVQGHEINSDKYHFDQLPDWFQLEKDDADIEEQAREAELDEARKFSDISDSSSESD